MIKTLNNKKKTLNKMSSEGGYLKIIKALYEKVNL